MGERDGVYWLGVSLRDGHGCAPSPQLALLAFRQAVRLNHVFSLVEIGHILPESDPQKYVWSGTQGEKKPPEKTLLMFLFFQAWPRS